MSGGSSGGSGAAVARRARAAGARLRHQRLDPRAVLAVRHFRPEADLRAAVARAQLSVCRKPRPCRPAGPHARAISRSPTTPCRAAMPTIRPAPTARPSRSRRCWNAASTGCASRSPAAISNAAAPRRSPRIDRVAAALGANRDIEIPEAERARSAAFIITASEGASLHLDRLRTRAERLRSRGARPADRGRHAAGVAGRQGAEIPPLVSRRGAQAVRRSRRHSGAGDAVHRAADRAADFHVRRCRNAGARQSRPLHAADLVHRPAGRRRAGAA